jgi:broad specificity phosphatase PhoE
MNSSLIVVRHGERIDEVEPDKWMNICRCEHASSVFRINDPPLTPAGCDQAMEVAESIKLEISDTNIPYIFCSKLTRAVETAYYIALKLSKPIVLSKGLAMTAAAVQHYKSFEFHPTEHFKSLYPAVEFIDGDTEEFAATLPLPFDDWYSPIDQITKTFPLSIIVAHRETIRNLMGRHAATPYCCYGLFDVQKIQRTSRFTGEVAESTEIAFRDLKQRSGLVVNHRNLV